MAYRIFVSHRSHSEEARQRLVAIAEALCAQGESIGADITVLYDGEQIAAGDDWRRRIAFMLHAAHAAIVLADEDALQSEWVRNELVVLAARRVLAPNRFRLFFTNLFDQLSLDEALQRVRGTVWNEIARLDDAQWVAGGTPATIASSVIAALDGSGALVAYQTPSDLLAAQLATELGRAAPESLQRLADRFGVPEDYVTEETAHRAGVALVNGLASGGTLVRAREALRELGTIYPDPCRRTLLENLFPLRIGEESAAVLARRRDGGGYEHAAVRSSVPDFVVPQYLARAHLGSAPPEHFAIANAEGTYDGIRAELRAAWRARRERSTASATRRPPTDEDVDRRLNAERYVWLPGPVDEAVLGRLQAQYPLISFVIVLDRPDQWDAVPALARCVRPELSEDREDELIDDYEDALWGLETLGVS